MEDAAVARLQAELAEARERIKELERTVHVARLFRDEDDADEYSRADIIRTVRREALEEAMTTADSWSRPDAIRLAAGEMTAQEVRTAQAVARGISCAIRALIDEEAT